MESIIRDFKDQLNSLDAGLSSQITIFQEQLNELQIDLETGLQEAMESAAAGGDAAAITEMNNKISYLNLEIEGMAISIQTLEMDIKSIMADLRALLEQMEIIKENKVDREELDDALRDKADKKDLNGMVSEAYFEAVRAQLEGRLKAAADKFAKCENVWQTAIEDIHSELSEKAEITQLEPLRDYIDSRLIELQKRIQQLAKAVGEPRTAGVTRRLVRDAECIACKAPAVLKDEDECARVVRLPEATVRGVRPPVVDGAEDMPPGEPVCYAEWPTEAHKCHRYCGGSHTLLPVGTVVASHFSDDMKVTPIPRRVVPMIGTDGQLYMTEEPMPKRPCSPCNPPPRPPRSSATDQRRRAPSVVPTNTGFCQCADDNDQTIFWMEAPDVFGTPTPGSPEILAELQLKKKPKLFL